MCRSCAGGCISVDGGLSEGNRSKISCVTGKRSQDINNFPGSFLVSIPLSSSSICTFLFAPTSWRKLSHIHSSPFRSLADQGHLSRAQLTTQNERIITKAAGSKTGQRCRSSSCRILVDTCCFHRSNSTRIHSNMGQAYTRLG